MVKVNMDSTDMESQWVLGPGDDVHEDMSELDEEEKRTESEERSACMASGDEVSDDVEATSSTSDTESAEKPYGHALLKADLEPYILRAHGTTDKIFHTGVGNEPPMLRNDRLNRIVLYSGGFNPPHKGHMELVRNVMLNSSADLNIVAAIVCPRDDEFVNRKPGMASSPYTFTKVQRVRLFKSELHSWLWVYDQRDNDIWDFMNRLRDYTKMDGFDVDFMSLLGPDYVSVHRTLDYRPNGCNEVIISDPSRPVDFVKRVSGELHFTGLAGYTSWEKSEVDKKYLASLVKKRPKRTSTDLRASQTAQAVSLIAQDSDVSSARKQLSLKDMITIAGNNWICYHCDHTERSIRFIPRELEYQEISSTQIREILTMHARDYGLLRHKLEPLALNVSLLLEFCVEINSSSLF